VQLAVGGAVLGDAITSVLFAVRRWLEPVLVPAFLITCCLPDAAREALWNKLAGGSVTIWE